MIIIPTLEVMLITCSCNGYEVEQLTLPLLRLLSPIEAQGRKDV